MAVIETRVEGVKTDRGVVLCGIARNMVRNTKHMRRWLSGIKVNCYNKHKENFVDNL